MEIINHILSYRPTHPSAVIYGDFLERVFDPSVKYKSNQITQAMFDALGAYWHDKELLHEMLTYDGNLFVHELFIVPGTKSIKHRLCYLIRFIFNGGIKDSFKNVAVNYSTRMSWTIRQNMVDDFYR
jgi:hypothetical protein